MDAKVGLFINVLDSYHSCILDEVEKAAVHEGIEIEVFDAQRSAMNQARELVHFQFHNTGKRLCVFVIPEADVSNEGSVQQTPIFQQAQRLLHSGVGWIMLNHGREEYISVLSKAFPHLPVALVEIDNVEFGRIQGQQLRKLLPSGGTVLCVRGNPRDSACLDRTTGMNKAIEGGGISIAEIDARWSADLAHTMVEKWMMSPLRRQKPLDAVVAQNDLMGEAARKVLIAVASSLRRPELARLPVIGGDGLPNIGQPMVDNKTLTATVAVTLPGKPALHLLARHWRDGVALPAVTRLPVTSYPPLGALSQLKAAPLATRSSS